MVSMINFSHWQYIYRIWRPNLQTNCRHSYGNSSSCRFILHLYEAEFVQEFLRKGKKKREQSFNVSLYINDVLLLNNKNFSNFLHVIYPVELVVKDSPNAASYLAIYLEHDTNGTLTTKLYDKRDEFNFPIVNYPFLNSNTPLSPSYGVYMSQLIRDSRTCNSYQDFLHRSVLLTRKLLSQVFIGTRLRSTIKKCFSSYHHLTLPCRVSVTTMANAICRPWYCCHEYFSFLDTTWDIMTGAACEAGNSYPSRAPDFTSGFDRGSCCPVICVSLFHLIVLSLGFWVLIVASVGLLGIYMFYFNVIVLAETYNFHIIKKNWNFYVRQILDVRDLASYLL